MEQPENITACPTVSNTASEAADHVTNMVCCGLSYTLTSSEESYVRETAAAAIQRALDAEAGAPEHGRTPSLLAVSSTDWLEPLREEIRRRDKALHEMWDRREEPDKCRRASCELNGLQLAFKLLTSGSNGEVCCREMHERTQ